MSKSRVVSSALAAITLLTLITGSVLAQTTNPFLAELNPDLVDSQGRFIGKVIGMDDFLLSTSVLLRHGPTGIRYKLDFWREDLWTQYVAYYPQENCEGTPYIFLNDGERDMALIQYAAIGKPGRTILIPQPAAPRYTGQVQSSWDPYNQECDNFDPYPGEDEGEVTPMIPMVVVGDLSKWYTQPFRIR